MKRLLLLSFILGWCCACLAQISVPRSQPGVTAVDARLRAGLDFYVPVANTLTLNGGQDSAGAIMLQMIDTSIYFRTWFGTWIRLLKQGDQGTGGAIGSINITMPSAFTVSGVPLTSSGTIAITANGANSQVILGDGSLGAYIPQLNLSANAGIQITGSYPNLGITNLINNTNQLTNGAGFLNTAAANAIYVQLAGSYANPSWITSLAYSKLTGTPTIPAPLNAIAGTNMSITGVYPNLTFNATGTTYTSGTFITSTANVFRLDTANYRKVDSIYSVNDSTIGVVLNGSSYQLQIKGGTGAGGGGGSGTVTIVTGHTANGVSFSISNPTSIPDITIILGNITPTSVNGLTLTALSTGFSIAGGTSSRTLTVSGNANVSGTNTGDLSVTGEVYGTLVGQVLTLHPIDLSGTQATGTLAAARFPAQLGDVTNSAGSLTNAIGANKVTYAKIQLVAASRILGNPTGAPANVSEISLAANGGIIFSGTTLLVDSTIYATRYFALHNLDTIRLVKVGAGINIGYTSPAGDTVKLKAMLSSTTIGVVQNTDSSLSFNSLLNFQNSLVLSGVNVNLVNDVTSPGNNYFYGTNSSGTKGFFVYSSLPVTTLATNGLFSASEKARLDSTIYVLNDRNCATCDSLLWAPATLDTLNIKGIEIVAGANATVTNNSTIHKLSYTIAFTGVSGGSNNIYNIDSTLAGNRTITSAGHFLAFTGTGHLLIGTGTDHNISKQEIFEATLPQLALMNTASAYATLKVASTGTLTIQPTTGGYIQLLSTAMVQTGSGSVLFGVGLSAATGSPLEIGYAPTGAFTKGGLLLDTVNNKLFLNKNIAGDASLNWGGGASSVTVTSPIDGDMWYETNHLYFRKGSTTIDLLLSGSAITSITGDATASGPGAAALTLATVNGNTFGSNTFLKFSVNAKGLVTAATAVVSADITAALGFTPANAATTTSGSYTPALTAGLNVASSTAVICYWVRVGSIVTVTGSVNVVPSAGNTSTDIELSLPIASAFTGSIDLSGPVTYGTNNGTGLNAFVSADAATDRADVHFIPTSTSGASLYFEFKYIIK